MYDPQTVAFDIKRPWPVRRTAPFMGSRWYWPNFITIWHVDPERSSRDTGLRPDDSCGWFNPPVSEAERERIAALGRKQYTTLFDARQAVQKGESAGSRYNADAYEAVYWAWRHIKYAQSRRYRWMYGPTRGHGLTTRELADVRSLASNPVDNVRWMVERIDSPQACAEFYAIVHRATLRLHRPKYRHPRWHVHHWRLQIHPLQAVKRWLFSRCAGCGARFTYGYAPTTLSWDGTGPQWFRGESDVYHSACAPSCRPQEHD